MKFRKVLWIIHKAGYDFVTLKDVMDMYHELPNDIGKEKLAAQNLADFMIDIIREI